MASPVRNLLASLRAIVGAEQVRTDALDLQHYGLDRTRWWRANPCAVVLPDTVEEVQGIIELAKQYRVAIVPSGGRTGLSGGAVAANGEIVLSLERMNRILEVDIPGRTMRCEAGVLSAQVQQVAREQGLFYPVDFASAGSSQIGGNVATNAGGIHVIRYGGTRERVLGLKVVTGCGDILDLNRGLIKNNCGPDLRHLFIGSEGILGIICEVTLALLAPPPPSRVMVVGVNHCPLLLDILAEARKHLRLSAFEFFSHAGLEKVVAYNSLPIPISDPANYYGLLEFDDIEGSDQYVTDFYQLCYERRWITDGVVSQSSQQATNLWRLREDISESLASSQPLKNDIAVTIAKMPLFISEMEMLLATEFPDVKAIWFGHLGDGNIHLNILKPGSCTNEEFAQISPQISNSILKKVSSFGGSISAEHGIGLLKKNQLHHGLSAAEINFLKQIKKVFDPQGILNPGKIFDDHQNHQ